MDKKSKIFFWVLFLAILASLGACFYRYVVLNDYVTFYSEEELPSPWTF